MAVLRYLLHIFLTMQIAALLVAILAVRVQGFPNSQNPFANGPPVVYPKTDPCTVVLFQNEALSNYGQVVNATYNPPAECQGPQWSRVILKFHGSVAGVQFDRAGALWLGGVELLRTTTPEPDELGIEWEVERDVTSYSSIFRTTSNATLQIPNTVNDQYTGVLYITATLVFWGADDSSQATVADAVIALSPPPNFANPWSSMSIAGNAIRNTTFKFPRSDVLSAALDLYASGHGCEEFWYSNVPDNSSGPLGLCGGGNYRQIEVYIDSICAGLAYPFPVIYTGGINPLLWRPLTGIYSFNIPPYTLDLSPFAGIINDGESHVLGVRVLGNNPEGSWFVDPVLRLSFAQPNLPASEATPLLGSLIYQRGPDTVVNLNSSSDPYSAFGIEFHTEGSASLRVMGSVGESVHTVESSLSASSQNAVSLDMGVSRGLMTSTSFSSIESPGAPTRSVTMEKVYPYNIISSYSQTETDFEIYGYVDYSAKFNEISTEDNSSTSLLWELKMLSNATYNRTNDYVYNVETDNSLAKFTFSGNQNGNCFEQNFSAVDGFVVKDEQMNSCTATELKLQQLKLCGTFDVCAPVPENVTISINESFAVNSTGQKTSLLFRSPQAPEGH